MATPAHHLSLAGLNEVALGIAVPKMWAALMARLVGQGPAEKLLQFAAMLKPAEARRLGLVDEVVPKEGLLVSGPACLCGRPRQEYGLGMQAGELDFTGLGWLVGG